MPNEFPHAECCPTRACVPVLSNYALWFVMRHCLDAHLFICRVSFSPSLFLCLSSLTHSVWLRCFFSSTAPCLLYGKDCSGKGANHSTGVLPAAFFFTPGMWPLNFVIMSLIPPPSPGLVSTFVRLLCHIQQASWSMTQAQLWLKKNPSMLASRKGEGKFHWTVILHFKCWDLPSRDFSLASKSESLQGLAPINKTQILLLLKGRLTWFVNRAR